MTNHYYNGGGRPKSLERGLIDGKGIFMEELESEILSRKLILPQMYGLGMDIASMSMETILSEFNTFMKSIISQIDKK